MSEKEKESLRLSEEYDQIKRKKLTKKQRRDIYNEFDGRCAYCATEITIEQMQVDHIKPLRLGGEDDFKNMICACRSCNKYKHTLSIEDFRGQLLEITKRLMRDSATFRLAERYGLIEIKDQGIKFLFEE